jgi:tetratricopeptide (TPR) repeat protein
MISESHSSPEVRAYHLMRTNQYSDALPYAEEAVAKKRACVPAHGMLATILLRLGRAVDAELVVVQALQLGQGIPDAYDALAHISLLLGKHERSNTLYKRVVEMDPGTARYWYNLASSERSFGRLLQAEVACDRAIALDSTQYTSYLLRSELRVQSSQTNHIEELSARLARPDVDDRARVLLAYALAKELDDLERFDEAFRWFREAASTRRSHLAYDVAIDEEKLRRIAKVFSPGRVQKISPVSDVNRHIFIVGLPRSGTTLLEHVLSGLPDVRSNGETDNFAQALFSAVPGRTDDIFLGAAQADPDTVATNYFRLAARGASGKHIIEKMPLNYLYLGAIRRALPTSKLLLVTREPIDSCFAMYRTLFGVAYPFTYDFSDLARYYSAYQRLIDNWRSCFGKELFELSYEDFVKDPAGIGTRIARHCDLPWNAAALEVQKSVSVSLTASASQIRRPIYGSSSGRWRCYRNHLDPLFFAMRKYGVSLPQDI